jgi:hypothetical protein
MSSFDLANRQKDRSLDLPPATTSALIAHGLLDSRATLHETQKVITSILCDLEFFEHVKKGRRYTSGLCGYLSGEQIAETLAALDGPQVAALRQRVAAR